MSTMLEAMIAYSTALLQAMSNWLSAEPMLYLFGAIVGCFAVNTLLRSILIPPYKNN